MGGVGGRVEGLSGFAGVLLLVLSAMSLALADVQVKTLFILTCFVWILFCLVLRWGSEIRRDGRGGEGEG